MAVEIRKPHEHVQPQHGGAHQPYWQWPANEAARLALAVSALDLRRQVLQLDTGDVWEVATTSPPSWRRIARPGAIELFDLGPSTAPVHVYVAASGSDTAAGTAAAPKQTLAGVWALLPALQTASLVVHLASGSYVWSEPPATVQRAATIVIIGDGAGQGADDGFEVLATGTVAAGSTPTSVATVEPLTPGSFVGCTIEMLTGAAAGNRRGIADTGASSIRLPTAFLAPGSSITAAAGDTFRIVRPSAVISPPASKASVWVPSGVRLALVNVAISSPTSVWSDCACWGVELRGGTMGVQTGVKVFAGAQLPDSTGLLKDVIGVPDTVRWYGWGLLCRTTFGYVASLGRDDVVEGFVCFYDFPLSSSGYLAGGRVGSISLANSTRLRLAGSFLVSGSGRPIYLQGKASLLALNIEAIDNRTTPATTSIVMQEQSELSCSTLSLNAPSLPGGSVPIDIAGQSRLQVSTLSVSAPVAHAIRLGDSCALNAVSITTTGIVSVYSCSKVTCQVLNCGPLLCYGNAEVSIGNAGSTCSVLVTGSMNGNGVLVIDGNARVSFGWNGGGYGSISIMNLATAASSDGVRVRGGGSLFCVVAPTISTAGVSGFGINARGGGRVLLPSTAAVSGPTADCTVGTAPGDDFSRSDLATALAGRVSGVSAIQRHQ